ncbi:hypothetical protein FPANT_8543 [Fusarium pseudoanthophilum]|uniref:Uncharacterized protein n=1 Tax=Fusarium pseudoanthophilum TaxID=48495 RepID=A0A8H5L085_9HYPO|nr:hypothetical protein FPANT_8543 [Fusarium pseudoanthophilum]
MKALGKKQESSTRSKAPESQRLYPGMQRGGDGAVNDHEFNDKIYNEPSQHYCAGSEATAVNALLPLSEPPLDLYVTLKIQLKKHQ